MNRVRAYFSELYSATVAGWNRFWFTPEDPATLACIRIATGLMLFYTHLVWGLELTEFFGPQGRLAASVVQAAHGSPFGWSHLFWITSPTWMWVWHGIALLVFVLLTVGLWTRVTSVLAALFTISYVHRGLGALYGLDQINVFLALYLAVGPSGAMYSVDAWRRGRGLASEERYVTARIAIRLMQLHMCIVYLFAGLGKMLGDRWWDGTAMWGAFANFEYQTIDMTWMGEWPLVIDAITITVVAWEISYIALVWPRLTRPIMIALAVPLHMGIALCMGMITFGTIMLVGNFSFVSPALVRDWIPANRSVGRHVSS